MKVTSTIITAPLLLIAAGFGCSDMNADQNRLSQSSIAFESKAPAFRMCATSVADFFAVEENDCIKIISSKDQKTFETIKIQPQHLDFSPSEPLLGIVTIHPKEKYEIAGTAVFWDCKARKEVGKVGINYGSSLFLVGDFCLFYFESPSISQEKHSFLLEENR